MNPMLTNVIITPIAIEKKGQKTFFEVKIPKDVDRVIGIELSITALSGVTAASINGRQVAGVLRMQAEGIANQCYSTQAYIGISEQDKKLPGFYEVYTEWQQNPYIGSNNREPEIISLYNADTLY